MNESTPNIEDNDLTFDEAQSTYQDEQRVEMEPLKSVDDYLQQGYYAHQSVVGHCLTFAEGNEGFYCLMLVSDESSKTPILVTTEVTQKEKRSDLQFIRSLSSSFGLKPAVIKVVDEESLVNEISTLPNFISGPIRYTLNWFIGFAAISNLLLHFFCGFNHVHNSCSHPYKKKY